MAVATILRSIWCSIAGHVNVIRVEKFSYNVRLFFFYLLRERN